MDACACLGCRVRLPAEGCAQPGLRRRSRVAGDGRALVGCRSTQDKKGSASFLSNTNRFMLRILSNPASTYSFEQEKRVRPSSCGPCDRACVLCTSWLASSSSRFLPQRTERSTPTPTPAGAGPTGWAGCETRKCAAAAAAEMDGAGGCMVDARPVCDQVRPLRRPRRWRK